LSFICWPFWLTQGFIVTGCFISSKLGLEFCIDPNLFEGFFTTDFNSVSATDTSSLETIDRNGPGPTLVIPAIEGELMLSIEDQNCDNSINSSKELQYTLDKYTLDYPRKGDYYYGFSEDFIKRLEEGLNQPSSSTSSQPVVTNNLNSIPFDLSSSFQDVSENINSSQQSLVSSSNSDLARNPCCEKVSYIEKIVSKKGR
jgi:hypothetical protein